MRTIKFRAWDLDNWHMYHSDRNEYNGEGDIVWEFGFQGVKFLEPTIIDRYCPSNGHVQDLEFKAPNQKIMQFTGLKDRHGIDVYEGDILDYHYFYFNGQGEGEKEMKVVVEYNEEFVSFGYATEEGFYPLIHEGTHEESFEVAGNIHQNPELINKANES